MPRQTPIRQHLPSRHLAQKWLSATDSSQGRIWRALYLLSVGRSVSQVAAEVGAHRNSVRNWVKLYNQQGAGFQPPVAPRPAPWRRLP